MSDDLLYVSWGGSGRAVSLRLAMQQAADHDQNLIYLAILDGGTFADLDETMLDLVTDELKWLLDAQLELARRQTGLGELEMRVVVRRGEVENELAETVQSSGVDQVLVGAPLGVPGGQATDTLLSSLERAAGVEVTLLEP